MVGGTLYFTFSDIYLVKTENEAVAPLNLNFIKHIWFNRCKKKDIIFKNLIKYHQNIKVTMEISLSKFLYTI